MFLQHIWPWNLSGRVTALEDSLKATQDHLAASNLFGNTCLAYLDQFEKGVHHVRMDTKLYCIGIDYCNEVTSVKNPRMNYKIENFDA